jgi:Rrf2 family protein
VGTNPSLIRRLMSQLARAGLATAQRGTGGGAVLGRPGERITLLDVYRAVEEEAEVIPVHHTSSPRCPIGRHMQAALEARIGEVERAMEEELARTTIADLAREVTGREERAAPGSG